ncbi:AGE family epimerase/isomerase [Pollutibacter soli]|uniref:AGE family epimerase/isomerase n=1 Tax=Pollutibacter soli TaxID=3034157 RepID=UPI00301398E5
MILTIPNFSSEVKDELMRIMDYWIKYTPDEIKGGFYGHVDANNKPDPDSPKGIVVNARILWTYAAVQQTFPDSQYLVMADRAYGYIRDQFIDKTYGGVYWQLNSDGTPQVKKKQLYGHSFALYALSEYCKIKKEKKVLDLTNDLAHTMIGFAWDKWEGGYIEAFEEDWDETDDYILSKGENVKSMNTHLHLLECFTNYYHATGNDLAKYHLKHSIEMMLDRIINPATNRMWMFFKDDWTPTTDTISYGHDIEASWLLFEAAEVLGDEKLIARCKEMSLKMAAAAVDGLANDGAINYEYEPSTKHLLTRKDWWPQAEAMVGFYNAYQLSGKVHYREKAEKVWMFIKKHLIDYEKGEWYGSVSADYKTKSKDKVTLWKCPYHNGRACLEMYKRLKSK